MIHTLLFLLKIIGIALLSLLGLLVFAVLVILFVPIRYSFRMEADEGLDARARVSWLLHLLHAEAVYDGTFGIVIRLLGIPIKRIPTPEEEVPRAKKAKHKKKKRPRKEKAGPSEKDENRTVCEAGKAEKDENRTVCEAGKAEKDGNRTVCEAGKAEKDGNRTVCEAGKIKEDGISEACADSGSQSEPETDTDSSEQTGEDDRQPDGGKREKLSFFQKIARFFRKVMRFFRGVRAFFSKILYTIRNICGKIEKIKDRISYYLEVLRSEEGQHTFALVKRELVRLLKHIAPTKLSGKLTIGMDDPAATGQIIAILSMFYPIYGNNVSITPDFDEKCMRGSLYLKGRIRIVTLIRIAWRVYFDKDIKKFLHMLKREENEA